MLCGLNGEPLEHGQVRGPDRRHLVAREQLVASVLADRLEHPVAGRSHVFDHDEGPVDEPAQAVECRHVRVRDPLAIARDDHRSLERPAAGEH